MNTIYGLPSISPAPANTNNGAKVEENSKAFGDMLTNMVDKVNNSQLAGDKAINDLYTGKAQHLHEVMIAVEQADVSLRMLVQMRNKAVTAYEEMMRMQI